MKKISATALSKARGITSKEIYAALTDRGWIEKTDDGWELTGLGESVGGDHVESARFGRYIVWPEDLDLGVDNPQSEASKPAEVSGSVKPAELLTASALGEEFGISATKVNYVLSELGWVKKGLKGWLVTDQGLKVGGVQAEVYSSGVPYVRWPTTALSLKSLKESIGQLKGEEPAPDLDKPAAAEAVEFRDKFPAGFRTTDGHMVRSKAEMLIDNWLYMAEIVHAYERKLPIEEDVYCDFYIPTGKVYIEYWGYENDPKYLARKQQKKEIYEKYGFNLIELNDKEVQNLDDYLPKFLLKFGVQAY